MSRRSKAERLGIETKALDLRRMGRGYAEIADALGLSKNRAWQIVVGALEREAAEPREDVRALEISRLDGLLRTWMPVALTGIRPTRKGGSSHEISLDEQAKAVDMCLRIMDKRARYLGLYAPERLEVVTVDAIERAIVELEAKFAADAALAARAGVIEAASSEVLLGELGALPPAGAAGDVGDGAGAVPVEQATRDPALDR